ncbi:hypothetical protein HK103_004097, partial [Boothiomyces macroporosus]
MFPSSCDNPEHRVMDIRNGILMWTPLNAAFDRFDFTIIKRGDKYFVETLTGDEFREPENVDEKELQLEILNLDGKQISFDKTKPNEWPGE